MYCRDVVRVILDVHVCLRDTYIRICLCVVVQPYHCEVSVCECVSILFHRSVQS